MPPIKLFSNPTKSQLDSEREQLRQSWNELNRRERIFKENDEFGRIHHIETDHICPNPSQPRKTFDDEAIIRLADSIRQYGILQPLTIRRLFGEGDGSLFELVAGERRLRAAKLLKFSTVPCIIINVDSKKSAELSLVENLQREDLNMFEQACSIASLIDMYKLTQDEIAKRLSTSQSYIANKLRLLRLTAKEREAILSHDLSERHARALLKIGSAEQRLRIIDYIHEHNLNVSMTEAYIERLLNEANGSKNTATRKIILKDIRIFYNSIDKAVSLIQQAGIKVQSERIEEGDSIELTIRIPKSQAISYVKDDGDLDIV